MKEKFWKRRPGEGFGEHLLRLNTIENLGETALLAAGAVLIPPAGAILVTGAAIAGAGAIGSRMGHQHLKRKRLAREAAKHKPKG